jgi:hypothetical protein
LSATASPAPSGLAPNVFLGKVGSDIEKPDGLVVITQENLPAVPLGLELQDVYGIGERMEQRLNRAGIFTVENVWQVCNDNYHGRPYCRTGECSRAMERCLTMFAPVASSLSARTRAPFPAF